MAPTLAQLDVSSQHWRGWRDWVIRYRRLIEEIFRWQPDLVYLRLTSYFPALQKLLKQLPVVVEINTDDVAEYQLTMSRKAYLYHRLTRGRLLSGARGMVAVTGELAERFAGWTSQLSVVSNGIRLEDLEPFPPPHNPQPRLVFVGQNAMPWHGVDHIAQLATACPQWQFDVVGDPSFGIASPPPNLQFHGFAKASEYHRWLARADVALGPLALYRKSMSESCALKVREYLAAGVPTILAGQDTDFPQEVPFLLSIPNTPDNIQRSLDRIRTFVQGAVGRRVPRAGIGQLELRTKETQRLAFFAKVLKKCHPAAGDALPVS